MLKSDSKRDIFSAPPGFRWGFSLWFLLALVLVGVRGVRWDENYEFAQIITGQVTYPHDHPMYQYVHGIFSGQTFSLALLMEWGFGPLLANGLRNLLYLLATVLPLYCFAAHLGRAAAWGHAAALLALHGLLLEFDGTYPHNPWPWIYSNGHVGTGFCLLVLYFLLARHWRTAACLASLTLVVHVGQAPVLLLVCGIYGLAELARGNWALVKQVAPWIALGVVLAFVLYATVEHFKVPSPETGPYAVAGDPLAVWRSFAFYHDPHRWLPPLNAHLVMLGGMLVAAVGFRSSEDPGERRIYGGVFLFILLTALTVWAIAITQKIMGQEVPMSLIFWLPYRLTNHAAPLLLAMGIALIARPQAGARGGMLAAALVLFSTMRPLIGRLMPDEIFHRYFFAGDIVFLLIIGAALVSAWGPSPRLRPLAGSWLLPTVLLVPFHQFGAACFLLGGALAWVKDRAPLRAATWGRGLAWAACALALLQVIGNGLRTREHLPVGAFEQEVTRWLAENDPDAGPLVAPPDTYGLQAAMNHAILYDAGTTYYLAYMPSLAPTIEKMHMDLYGSDFGSPRKSQAIWNVLWERRDAATWRTLGAHYDVSYVMTPPDVKLDLTPVVQHERGKLYRIAR